MRPSRLSLPIAFLAVSLAAGCSAPMRAWDALPSLVTGRTAALASMKDDIDSVSEPRPAAPGALPSTLSLSGSLSASSSGALGVALPSIEGRGLSQVSKQPGASTNQRRLLAIRAARLEALRDLTEQVHGISIDSETTVAKAMVSADRLRGIVSGEIRGARTVRITPKGSDGYEVVMSLDPDVVAYIVRAARLGV